MRAGSYRVGNVVGLETCDPPGLPAGRPSACRNDCRFCGDGRLEVGPEQCDDRNNASGDGCSAACLFEGCDEGGTTWADLSFDVETPDGTWVVFSARTADTKKNLKKAQWLDVAAAPSGMSPVWPNRSISVR